MFLMQIGYKSPIACSEFGGLATRVHVSCLGVMQDSWPAADGPHHGWQFRRDIALVSLVGRAAYQGGIFCRIPKGRSWEVIGLGIDVARTARGRYSTFSAAMRCSRTHTDNAAPIRPVPIMTIFFMPLSFTSPRCAVPEIKERRRSFQSVSLLGAGWIDVDGSHDEGC